MSILISQEILHCIKEELLQSRQSFTAISAYCKLPLVTYFDNCISDRSLKKRIIVRMRMSDILDGSTDLSIYPFCKEHGWELYFKLDLHGKTYIFDGLKGIVGSANATYSGMNMNGHGNYEMATLVELEQSDRAKIDQLFQSSVRMTDDILEQMQEALGGTAVSLQDTVDKRWPNAITSLFSPDYSVLFTEEFPPFPTPDFDLIETCNFLGCRPSAEMASQCAAFKEMRCFKWLIYLLSQQDSNEMYFGAITASLHNSLLNEPKPYRKDVKVLLANLLKWIHYYGCKEIVVDQPNYSQRVILREAVPCS